MNLSSKIIEEEDEEDDKECVEFETVDVLVEERERSSPVQEREEDQGKDNDERSGRLGESCLSLSGKTNLLIVFVTVAEHSDLKLRPDFSRFFKNISFYWLCLKIMFLRRLIFFRFEITFFKKFCNFLYISVSFCIIIYIWGRTR